MNRTLKDSGITWLGEIPEYWQTKKVKYIFRIIKNIANEKGHNVLSVTQKGLKIKDISSNEGQIAMDYGKYQLVNPGDFVMNHMDLLTGWVDCSKYNGVTSPDYRVFKFIEDKSCSSDYYKYIFQMCYSNKIFYGLGQGVSNLGRWRLQTDKFINFVLPLPSLNEQQKISKFLDQKVSQIDSIIENTKLSIEELIKYKQVIITEAVTKGLHPDVEMKDSGIEWIGQIPVTWNTVKLKYLLKKGKASMKVGPFGSQLKGSDFIDEGFWVYNQRTVLDKNFKQNNTYISEKKYNELIGFKVEENDILVTTRGSIGKICKVPSNYYKGIIHPCIIKFRLDESLMIFRLFELIFNETDFVREQLSLLSNSTTIDVVYSNTLKNIFLVKIPIQEQQEIMSYLEGKISHIDNLLKQKQQVIKELQEYKKSLIYEYVTGKKEVL